MVQNTWQYQGRQKHGEWGHGTAPQSVAEPSEADTRAAPDDAAMRATYVAYGAIAHLPRETFRVLESHLERGGLQSFQKAVAAYPATAHLDDESWRAHVTGDTLPSVSAARLRAALEITHAAATQGDINHGSMHFAALVGSTGVPKTMGAVAKVADAADGGLSGQETKRNPPVQLAAGGDLPCVGFSGGCQGGGAWGSTGMYLISGRVLCAACAEKYLGLTDLPSSQRAAIMAPFLLPPFR